MSDKYFDIKDSLYSITEKYPEAIELLVSVGFNHMKDAAMRENFGKTISLENALKLKKINIETFCMQLIEKIEEGLGDHPVKGNDTSKDKLKLVGVLPCPVKIPLLEGFENWLAQNPLSCELDYELKAASMGLGWLIDSLGHNAKEELPDLFISAGFELFFDKDLFAKYKAENLFEDITGLTKYNEDFDNASIQLKDPKGQYAMIGVVPAIFLVNQEELKGRKAPVSWEDLLKEEFDNSVSLPIGDFDLFNSILLNIYKNYGEEGITRLGKILKTSMHPSEMVKSHMKQDKPAVTIMPYFFTKMIKEEGPMQAIWPKDGAVISPIFMLSKKDKKEALKPLVDFFASKEVGEILAHNGRFPSVHQEVDNKVPKENAYMWLGWDYIQNHDIKALIKKSEELFNQAVKGVN